MKLFATLIFSFFSYTFLQSQIVVELRSGKFVNKTPEINPSNNAANFNDCIYDGKYFLWLQFNQLPIEEVKQNLLLTGVQLFDYLPRNTYVASFPINYDFNILKQYNVYAVTKPIAAAKIDVSLYNATNIVWAVTANNNLKVNISFTPYLTANNFIIALKNVGIFFTNATIISEDIITVEASLNEIQKIATNPLVQYIEPCTKPAVVEDIQGVTNHRTNYVQTSDNWINGRKIDGTGVTIAVGDDGFIGPHIDFQGRLIENATNTSASNTHSDHVCGIVFGAGNLNPQVRGQAPGANLYAYDSYAPYSLFPGIYNTDKVRIVSHSLGQGCNEGYNSNARQSDQLTRTYPNLMYVHSAGNSGNSNCGGLNGWRNITGGFKAGKTVMTVANLSKADVADATSSRGPLPDGRIKPDIAAVGTSVNSTQPDNTFAVFGGTSMSCPAVTGNFAVLYHAFKNKNAGVEPAGALIKAIVLNTADDIGNIGPDFIYGWGRINVRKAVNCIDSVKYLTDNITTGVTKTHIINIPANVATAKIMVYWADREAASSAAKSLVNNIDAKLIASDLAEYKPWVLDITATPDENTVNNPAIYGTDSINNVEQIQLDNPTAGNYTLNLLGKAIPSGPQRYYVVYDYTYNNEIVVTYPNGGESFAPSDVQRIRWDAAPTSTNFKIEYSTNNGTSWINLNANIASDRRYVDWTVPNSAVSKMAKIRVSNGTFSDVSDTSFIILRVPSGINFTQVCTGTSKISWTAVASATGYDVFRLGTKYMEQVASTTTLLNVTLDNVGDTVNWFAVRAKLGAAQANGRRSLAVAHTNSSLIACPVPVKLISFTASLKNGNVLLNWNVANEEGMLNYVVEKSATATFDNFEIVGQLKPNNIVAKQYYELLDKNLITIGTWYYRLKMVENNKALYSNIQAVKIDKIINNAFLLSPNPVVNVINLLSQIEAKNAIVKVYNNWGKEVMFKNIGNIKVADKITLQTDNLSAGNYVLIVMKTDNSTILFKQQITIMNN